MENYSENIIVWLQELGLSENLSLLFLRIGVILVIFLAIFIIDRICRKIITPAVHKITSRTETKYFHLLLRYNPKILFFKGRLHFNESKNSAPFPSCLIILEQGRTTKEYDSITSVEELKERGC